MPYIKSSNDKGSQWSRQAVALPPAPTNKDLDARNSSFPTPRAASILNKEGVFMSPVPTSNVSFPYNASNIPDAITSQDWAIIPHTKGECAQQGQVVRQDYL